MAVSKTSDHQDANPSKEPAVSSKSQNVDLKDIDVLCTLKIKIESKNLDHGYIKNQWPYQNQIKMPNPSQEPPASYKAPNEDLRDMDVLCAFKIKIESQNLDHGCNKDQWP